MKNHFNKKALTSMIMLMFVIILQTIYALAAETNNTEAVPEMDLVIFVEDIEQDEEDISETIYIVENGDSYWSISESLFGTGIYYEDIKKYNDKEVIMPDEEIFIPMIELEEINEEFEESEEEIIEESEEENTSLEFTENNYEPIVLTGNTDLCYNNRITETDMKYIIDSYYKLNKTEFKDCERYFIEASEITGLSPLYIFAHASLESGYGKYHHGDKYNYFGICAYDSDPSKSLFLGGDKRSGIIEGAIWIKREYYDNGLTTLNKMYMGNSIKAPYASGQGWVEKIVYIGNRFI